MSKVSYILSGQKYDIKLGLWDKPCKTLTYPLGEGDIYESDMAQKSVKDLVIWDTYPQDCKVSFVVYFSDGTWILLSMESETAMTEQ